MSDEGNTNIITFPPLEEVTEKFEKYCMAVGKASYAWNYLHECLGQLFAALSDDRDEALVKWYSLRNDVAQRDLLRKFVERAPIEKWSAVPQAPADILWLLAQIDGLAEDRNNAIHAPATLYITQSNSEMGPNFVYGHPRANKLRGKNLLHEFDWCERCAETCSVYTRKVETSVGFPERFDWPDRPNLPPRPEIKKLTNQQNI